MGKATDLANLWTSIRTDLTRARNTLPDVATNCRTIHEYAGFLEHNELELACDMLEAYGKQYPVSRDFWLALRHAATKMSLPDRASRYEGFSLNG